MSLRAVWALTAAMVLASGAYAVLALARSWVLLTSGDVVQIALALSIVVVPVLGMALVLREVWFGWRSRQMGRILTAEGGLPEYHGELTPSGRPTKEDADRNFERYAQQAEEWPEDWRVWFRLAVAYDDARDRKRARAAMRHAASLFEGESRR